MGEKVTWLKIYQDFKQRCPNLAKRAVDYCAFGPTSILVCFADGSRLVYGRTVDPSVNLLAQF